MPAEAEIRDLFYQWNSALATLNPENVADMYAKDGVLLPTVSNKVSPAAPPALRPAALSCWLAVRCAAPHPLPSLGCNSRPGPHPCPLSSPLRCTGAHQPR